MLTGEDLMERTSDLSVESSEEEGSEIRQWQWQAERGEREKRGKRWHSKAQSRGTLRGPESGHHAEASRAASRSNKTERTVGDGERRGHSAGLSVPADQLGSSLGWTVRQAGRGTWKMRIYKILPPMSQRRDTQGLAGLRAVPRNPLVKPKRWWLFGF